MLHFLLDYCILLKAGYLLLSIQIIPAALNTKSEFQVAVTPAEMCKYLNEVDRTSEILGSQAKTMSQNLFKWQQKWAPSPAIQVSTFILSCNCINNPNENTGLHLQYFTESLTS